MTSRPKILVVDDDYDVRRLIGTFLNRLPKPFGREELLDEVSRALGVEVAV